jgi:hypothetical protein
MTLEDIKEEDMFVTHSKFSTNEPSCKKTDVKVMLVCLLSHSANKPALGLTELSA